MGFKNDRVDQILVEARKTLDRSKRNKLYQELSQFFTKNNLIFFSLKDLF